MGLGIIYLVVIAVSVACGYIGRNNTHSYAPRFAMLVGIAACLYAGYNYSWFHVLGIFGITVIATNAFTAIEAISKHKQEEQAKIDELFDVGEEDEEK